MILVTGISQSISFVTPIRDSVHLNPPYLNLPFRRIRSLLFDISTSVLSTPD